MKMKSTCRIALFAASGALFAMTALFSACNNDDRIESSAKNTYVFKTYLKGDSIKAKSEDGAVVLTGTVATAAHKTLAQDTVEGLPGVKSVDNQLVVVGPPATQDSNEWLSIKVDTALMFHRNVSASNTKVSVNNGIVTLSGEASSLAQKELTTEYAQDVDGVTSVVNVMTVAKEPAKPEQTAGEKVDDASITAQVKVALAAHHSTSAIKTTVVTTNGAVTITGIAKNDAEKSLVTKLVNDIQGVISVDNKMTVAELPATTK
jgi:osmotically-inducible protein OsmY